MKEVHFASALCSQASKFNSCNKRLSSRGINNAVGFIKTIWGHKLP